MSMGCVGDVWTDFIPLGPGSPRSPGRPLYPGGPRAPGCPIEPETPGLPGGPAGPGRPTIPGARGLLRLAASWAIWSVYNRRIQMKIQSLCSNQHWREFNGIIKTSHHRSLSHTALWCAAHLLVYPETKANKTVLYSVNSFGQYLRKPFNTLSYNQFCTD